MDCDENDEKCTDENMLTDPYFNKSRNIFYIHHPDLRALQESAEDGYQFFIKCSMESLRKHYMTGG
jgi:hypothetical protein